MKTAIYSKLEGKKQNRRLTISKEYKYTEYKKVITVYKSESTFKDEIKFSDKDFDKYFLNTKRQRNLKLKKLEKIDERR